MARWYTTEEPDDRYLWICQSMMERFWKDKANLSPRSTVIFVFWMIGCREEGEPCRTPMEELSQLTNSHPRTVKKHLAAIVDFLERDRAEFGDIEDDREESTE